MAHGEVALRSPVGIRVSVLREAMTVAPGKAGAPSQVFFGTTSGHVFASFDAGDSWQRAAEFLPRVLCIAAAPGSAAP